MEEVDNDTHRQERVYEMARTLKEMEGEVTGM